MSKKHSIFSSRKSTRVAAFRKWRHVQNQVVQQIAKNPGRPTRKRPRKLSKPELRRINSKPFISSTGENINNLGDKFPPLALGID